MDALEFQQLLGCMQFRFPKGNLLLLFLRLLRYQRLMRVHGVQYQMHR